MASIRIVYEVTGGPRIDVSIKSHECELEIMNLIPGDVTAYHHISSGHVKISILQFCSNNLLLTTEGCLKTGNKYTILITSLNLIAPIVPSNVLNPNLITSSINPNLVVNPNLINSNLITSSINPNLVVNPNLINPNLITSSINPNLITPNLINPNLITSSINPNLINPNLITSSINPNLVVNPNLINPNLITSSINPNLINPNLITSSINPNLVVNPNLITSNVVTSTFNPLLAHSLMNISLTNPTLANALINAGVSLHVPVESLIQQSIINPIVPSVPNIVIKVFKDKNKCVKSGTALLRNLSISSRYQPTTLTSMICSGGIFTMFPGGQLRQDNCCHMIMRCDHRHSSTWCRCHEVVSDFDITRFMGRWHHMACIGSSTCMTSIFTLLDTGIRMVQMSSVNAMVQTLAVQLLPGQMVVHPSLNINFLVHDTDHHTFSMIGTPDRSNLVIMCRKKHIDKCLLKKLKSCAHSLGYDTSRLSC